MLHLLAQFFRFVGRLFGGGRAEDDAAPAPEAVPAAAPEDGVFVDRSRGRSVPYRLYPPEGGTGAAPVVLFSHGLGGSRRGAPYLGRALGEAGYWGVFVQHHGSDEKVFAEAEGFAAVREALLASLLDPSNMVNRFRDIPFVLDELERLNTEKGGRFRGRFDLAQGVGIAGHSYGARTVLAMAGQTVGPVGAEFLDPRIVAGVALSPSGGRGIGEDEVLPPEHFAAIGIPILHVTGTEDTPPLSEDTFDPYIRTLPFQMIPAGEQYLVVFKGATHDDFSGMVRGDPAPDNRYTVTVAEMACLFFDAYLKGSETAWSNLRNRVSEYLEKGDYYEYR